VSDGYLFNDALTNAFATQRRMRNDVIIMVVRSVKGSAHRDPHYNPEVKQLSHLLTHFGFTFTGFSFKIFLGYLIHYYYESLARYGLWLILRR
jgi:hypothetical protein